MSKKSKRRKKLERITEANKIATTKDILELEEESGFLYSIRHTKSGPIIMKVWNPAMTKERPEIYLRLKKKLYLFEEAQKYVLDWFENRKKTIKELTEDTYFNTKERQMTFITKLNLHGEYYGREISIPSGSDKLESVSVN